MLRQPPRRRRDPWWTTPFVAAGLVVVIAAVVYIVGFFVVIGTAMVLTVPFWPFVLGEVLGWALIPVTAFVAWLMFSMSQRRD